VKELREESGIPLFLFYLLKVGKSMKIKKNVSCMVQVREEAE
jgi:hypothetical protein